MLLQLVEPTVAPFEPDLSFDQAIGIDLGTTYSLVAYVDQGKPVVIPLEGTKTCMPSAVSFKDNRICVGTQALTHLVDAPHTVMRSVKRLMGVSEIDESSIHKDVFRDGRVYLDGRSFTPTEVSSEILKVLKEKAERFLNKTITNAVITVPAYFDEIARAATRDAAKLAGLNVLRIINEPTAALLAYGLDEKPEGLYAVYDLGGGTFDFSLLKLTRGVFQVLGTGGDIALGGDDVDRALADHIIKQRVEFYPDLPLTPHLKKTILFQARYMKEQLSHHDHVTLKVEDHHKISEHQISRDDLIQLIQPMITQTLLRADDVLDHAGVTAQELKGIVLVGGSTRLPILQECLSNHFGCPVLFDISPDEAVVCGAALQAYALTAGRPHASLLIDVTPLSLGLETMGGLVERIIERNSPIPSAKAQIFTTYQDGQTAIKLHVVQGERELAEDCISLGAFELTGIPPLKAGIPKIEVTFILDADGLLTVSAVEKSTGVNQNIQVKPSYGLKASDLKEIIFDAFEHASDDYSARKLKQAQVRAQQDINRMVKIIEEEDDKKLKETLTQRLNDAQRVVLNGAREEIEGVMKVLEEEFVPLLEKRLNRLFKDMVVGKKISDIS